MKRVSKTGLFVWLVLWLTAGCTRTEVEEKDFPPQEMKEVDAVFNLNVLANQALQTRSITFTPTGTLETDSVVPGRIDSAVTKSATALTEADESLISQLWVGQYDASGNRVFSQYIAPMTGTTVNLKLKASGETTHHVWFVANCDDFEEVATEAALKERVLTYASTAEGLPENRLCGMTGMWPGIIQDNGVESIAVDMKRTVAKISFSYLIGGTDFSFTPSSVTLKSVPNKIRIEEMTTQFASDVMYGEYTGEANANGATMHWYLPENRAGAVTDENAATSDKEKTGKGVSNATCIELTGTAVQGGVSYENVTFRFYPGSKDYNDYNIKRNHYYTMSVTLKGIDVTDQRITVGTIPPIDTGGLKPMPASKGGTTELQVTARPGQPWTIKLPDWLSALIDNTIQAGTGANISHQGPAKIVFKADKANPTAQQRSFPFKMDVTGKEQSIEIVQNGSTINVGDAISLEAASDSEGQSSFTVTKGLNWRAVLSDSWLGWASSNAGSAGDEATGENQILTVKATSSNPEAATRTGKITVESGQSVGSDTYEDLKKPIPISQAGSTVTCSTNPVEVSAEGATGAFSTFTATPDLPWKIAVPEANKWLELTGQTSGQTTTNPQSVAFNVPVNPDSEVRTGAITVHVGDETKGPTGNITVNQAASSLTVDEIPTPLAPTAEASGSIGFTATQGLSYAITHSDWLTFADGTAGTTSGGKQTFNYKANSVNKNKEARSGNISVTAGNMKKETAVTQEASVFKVEPTEITLPNTESSGTVSITGTSGLMWSVIRSSGNDGNTITANPTNGTIQNDAQQVTFNAPLNSGNMRSAIFTIAVSEGNHSVSVTVSQNASLAANEIKIDETVLKRYYNRILTNPNKGYSWRTHPPFDADGTNMATSFGITDLVLNENPTMTGFYILQIQKGQKPYVTDLTYKTTNYNAQKQYCNSLNDDGGGWRLPTELELYEICVNKEKINNGTDIDPLVNMWIWSSSLYDRDASHRCRVRPSDLVLDHNYADKEGAVRCVRIKKE